MALPRAIPLVDGTGLQVVDFLTAELVTDFSDGFGTIVSAFTAPEPGFLWRIERCVFQCQSSVGSIWTLFVGDRRAELLRDFDFGGNAGAHEYPNFITVEATQPLIVQWAGADPFTAFGTLSVQYQLVQRVAG